MSYQDHLRTCSYCNGTHNQQTQKPTVRIKSASSYRRERKLSGLAALITGASYPEISYVGTKARRTSSAEERRTNSKGASASCAEKQSKLKELAKLIRG